MPYPNEHACQLMDPNTQHENVARATKTVKGKSVGMILYMMGGKSKMQAMRFPKDAWSAEEAAAMCKTMGGNFEAASEAKKGLAEVVFGALQKMLGGVRDGR